MNGDPMATKNLSIQETILVEGGPLGTGQHTNLVRYGRPDQA